MGTSNKRKHMDVYKLMMSDYKVEMADDAGTDFYVDFTGPEDTAYEGGKWQIHINLPPQYPYRSPSVGFKNRIFHPNVDFRSGTICLDVINQTWSPMFDLLNIFDTFLPQLLAYPNPADPLNNEAASMLLNDPETYNAKVREHVKLYASSAPRSENSDESSLKQTNTSLKDHKNDGAQANQACSTTRSEQSVSCSFGTVASSSNESQDHHSMDLETLHADTDVGSDDEDYPTLMVETDGFDLAV